MAESNTRIAIIDANKCRPKRCAQECKKVNFSEQPSKKKITQFLFCLQSCPVVRMGAFFVFLKRHPAKLEGDPRRPSMY